MDSENLHDAEKAVEIIEMLISFGERKNWDLL